MARSRYRIREARPLLQLRRAPIGDFARYRVLQPGKERRAPQRPGQEHDGERTDPDGVELFDDVVRAFVATFDDLPDEALISEVTINAATS